MAVALTPRVRVITDGEVVKSAATPARAADQVRKGMTIYSPDLAFACNVLLYLGLSEAEVANRVRMAMGLDPAPTVAKHGGPGPHRTTRTPQSVHAGEIVPSHVGVKARLNAISWLSDRDITADSLYANTVAILDRASPESLFYGKNWYPTASGVARDLSSDYDVSLDAAAGILAALSPRNKWRYPDDDKYFTQGNVADAYKVLAAVQNPVEVSVDAQTAEKIQRLFKVDITPGVHNTASLTPAAQAALDPRVGGLPDNLVKAFRIARGESVDEVLGGPKVRSFYNNIRFVDESRSATVDSHQVRAMIGRIDLPDKVYEEIASNPARYDFFADVVRQVADDRDMPPHVVQAITWEQWRREHDTITRRNLNPSNIASAADVTLGSVVYAAPTVARKPRKRRKS